MLALPSPARADAPQFAAPQPTRGTVSKGQPGGTANTLPWKLTNLGYGSPKDVPKSWNTEHLVGVVSWAINNTSDCLFLSA